MQQEPNFDDFIIPGREDVLPGQQDNANPSADSLRGTGDTIPKSKDDTGEKTTGPEESEKKPDDSGYDIKKAIAEATRQGGLKSITDDFRSKYWTSIHSEIKDPFAVLFLDYTQWDSITPEAVSNNYQLISGFWEGIASASSDGIRTRQKKLYGEQTIDTAEEVLKIAYRKLSNTAGIAAEAMRLGNLRRVAGYRSLAERIDTVVEYGELKRKTGYEILIKGKENGLTEQEAYEHLLNRLKEAGFSPRAKKRSENELDNEWMTDVVAAEKTAQAKPQVSVNNILVESDKEIGEILYNNEAWAKRSYIHNTIYLPTDIAKLYNSEYAQKIEALINSESNVDRRYLSVVYRLNPTLPFRLNGRAFINIYELLQATTTDYGLFNEAAKSFANRHIQAWLNETDPISKELYGDGTNMNDFLDFIYKVNQTHPFYISGEKYESPGELISKSSRSVAGRARLSDSMTNGQLFTWLRGLGMSDVLTKYNHATEAFVDSPYHTEQDKLRAAAQAMILTLDTAAVQPAIKTSAAQIILDKIEGTGTETFKLQCTNTAGGFVKANIYLKDKTEGITCTPDSMIFESEAGPASGDIFLSINSLLLTKDKTYNTALVIETIYEKISIPVTIKVIFPRKSYQLLLMKYAAIFAVLFGVIRYATSKSHDFIAYLGSVAVLAAVFIYAWKVIKKWEKL